MNNNFKNNRMYGKGYRDGVADCVDDIREAQENMDKAWEYADKAWEHAKEADAKAKEADAKAKKALDEAKESIEYCNKSQAKIDECQKRFDEITAEQNHLRIENRLFGDKAVKAEKAEKEAVSAHRILVLNGVRGEPLEAVHDVIENHAQEALDLRAAIEANKTQIRVLGGEKQTIRLALADAHLKGDL